MCGVGASPKAAFAATGETTERRAARRSLKGQMRVVETIFASFVILFAIFFINAFTPTPSSPAYEVSDLERLGENVLQSLDEQGLLSQWVYTESWGNLTAALRVLLPSDVHFNLSIYDADGNLLNQGTPIQYGNPESFSNSRFVASVTYVLPGYQRTYEPRVLRLQLVGG